MKIWLSNYSYQLIHTPYSHIRYWVDNSRFTAVRIALAEVNREHAIKHPFDYLGQFMNMQRNIYEILHHPTIELIRFVLEVHDF